MILFLSSFTRTLKVSLFFFCCFLVILICRIVLTMLNRSLPTVGEFHCPVLNKVFTEFTHIVAVKTTGNVFCYEVCLSFFLTLKLVEECY